MEDLKMTNKPRTFVKIFKPQFAPLVQSGEKQQTIRPAPKRTPKVGDLIDCREWEGKPYRSKQRKLGIWPITEIKDVTIWEAGLIFIDEMALNFNESKEVAQADGFKNPKDMIQWFSDTHGLPFVGILISWRPL
jgi:hypothetical protein